MNALYEQQDFPDTSETREIPNGMRRSWAHAAMMFGRMP
ncbi:MAG: hypothetical protein QOH97_4770 [Actinoplanes sp.]|jgi:hypothetical protein|nr:hypothetical protein [Actinoplanes sp.]